MSYDTPTPPAGAVRSPMIPVILMMAITALVLWPMALLNPEYLVQGSSAEELYHLPLIEKLSSELPAFDYSDYSSATTPGYHTAMAFPHAAGVGYRGVRIIASLWTIALVGLMAWVVGKRCGFRGDILVLPLIATNYLLFPGMWLLPDNAGWLGVFLILLLCLNHRPTWKLQVWCGIALLLLVFVRQVHIWMAAPVWLAAWIGNTDQTPTLGGLFEHTGKRIGRAVIAAVCTVPAFLLIAYFVNLWGGLVPPTFQDEHHGLNRATPGFMLLQVSVLSVFFTPVVLPRFKELLVAKPWWILGAVLLGIVFGIVPHSSFDPEGGRYGGWWNLIEKAPLVMDRSPIYIIGSVTGGVLVVVWGSMLSRRDAWILGGTLAVFMLAQTVNTRAWQRYHEPMLLILLVLIMARAYEKGMCRKRLMLGSVALSLMLAAVTGSLLMKQVPRGITDPRVEALKSQQLPAFSPIPTE